ncbi:hypothetical protein DICSQDRAFT_104373 [Dichomitus squalens LYAD-421 SS1]|uniref:Cell division control protein 14, SIN component-domain-containing protein n=1 Tax=Dichomitus squalens (strain LYAD-421) TaxID=732165 RepID=R7T142_DICSQ|nr:uncharacterized protein DICSQDRAFT_104373 [Dichomitus squalens LYAD-421 SS1]EJF62149.1 hypothetical protein DICSQDRAFT_104373 [Dichomitus squalens LYAD-421 SS1]
MDPDVDDSNPITAPMHVILQDALDELVSIRTSTATKGDALVAIEHVLAETSDPRAVGLLEYFNELQDTFQCNVSSRIISWTSVTSGLLDKALHKGSTDDVRRCEVISFSSQLAQGMSIIQGVALIHKPSKQFLGRRYSLEVLLDLLLVSRHLTTPTASSMPTSPIAGVSSASPPKSSDAPLASVILDTLLCILVDSSPALRVFEDLNGVQVVVRILKRAGTPREVRMKCLEFLYFYLLDETTPPELAPDAVVSDMSISETPTARSTISDRSNSSLTAAYSAGYSTAPSSRSSSGSSAFSVLSTSTTATSASLLDASISPKPHTHVDTPAKPALKPKSVIPGLTPSTRNITPPSGGSSASALGRVQSRSKLLMLKNEVDYVPLSPKKPQLSHLGRGPSGLRPKPERGPSHSKLRLSSEVQPAEDTRGNDLGGSSLAATRWTSPNTPHASRASHSHSRGISVSSISSISSISSVESASLRTGQPPTTPGTRRDKLKSNHTEILETPKPASSKVQAHRRAQSLADFSSPSASDLSPLAASRCASTPTSSGAGTEGHRGPKTMAEKKEILGTMLGNVDALVEGVKKAGVWGLS